MSASAGPGISWWRTSFGQEESSLIADAIAHEHVSQGVVTERFEAELAGLLGVPGVVATTSGSMALLMGLLCVGVGPGDEVIVPNRTWIATAHAPLLLGAKPILVDVEPDRPIIDAARVEERITARTKAIVPVHLNGRSADMTALSTIANRHGIAIVEDAAQALGSRNALGPLGTQSAAGCFSLSVAKIISTGQGGFIAAPDEATAERLRLMRTHGVSDVMHATYTTMGFNFRFNDVLASIGMAQLRRLKERVTRVVDIYRRYEQGLDAVRGARLLPADVDGGEVPVYVEVMTPSRARLMEFLADRGIQTRPFYPDLDTAPHLADGLGYPNSRAYGEQGLFLPCGPGQLDESIDRVIDALRSFDSTPELRHDGGGPE